MNWHHSYDHDGDLIRVHADGHVSENELVDGTRSLTDMPCFHSHSRVLFDFHQVTSLSVHADGIVGLAQHPAFSSNSKRAFVTQSGMVRGFFSFHCVYASPGPARVFDSIHQAIAWLDDGRALLKPTSAQRVAGDGSR